MLKSQRVLSLNLIAAAPMALKDGSRQVFMTQARAVGWIEFRTSLCQA
jgi:hypothetical protein